jgi:hypothetical protein
MKPNYAEFAAPVALEGDEPRRFSGVAYSGGLASPAYWGPSVVDLASTSVAAPLPLLFRHDHDRLSIGLVTAVTNDGTRVTDAGELHTDLDDNGGRLAKGIAARAKKGEPYQQSLGLYDFSDEHVPPQKMVEVNGRTFQGPLTVMRGGTVREITFAPLGADPMTSAAVYAAATTTEPRMPEVDPKVAELTAELNGLRPQLSDATQQVAKLTAERDAFKAKLTAAETRLTEMRTGAVKALFTDCGLTYDDAKAAPYLGMSQEVFDSVAANLRAAHTPATGADDALFQHQATGDPNGTPAGKVEPRKLRPVSELYAHFPQLSAQKEG